MGVLVQVRDLPEDVHRTLKARAAEAGQSLSEFLRVELEKIATRPTQEEILRRVRSRTPVRLSKSPAELVREMRETV
jgi:plasmid stability protein